MTSGCTCFTRSTATTTTRCWQPPSRCWCTSTQGPGGPPRRRPTCSPGSPTSPHGTPRSPLRTAWASRSRCPGDVPHSVALLQVLGGGEHLVHIRQLVVAVRPRRPHRTVAGDQEAASDGAVGQAVELLAD